MKRLNITNHYGNADQKYEILCYTFRMATVKKWKTKCWQGCGEIRTLVHCWEFKMIQTLRETEWQFLKKLKIEVVCDLVVTLPDIYQKN